MAKSNHFDFMAAANHGYVAVWENRHVILRLAALPLFITLGCVAAILFMGYQSDVLKHGLMMLPAYFAEGFLVAYIIRVLYSGDHLGGDVKQARRYFDDVIAAMIVFVLIKLALAVLLGLTMSTLPENVTDAETVEISGNAVLSLFGFFAFLVWGFRFLWLYVPLAMGIPLKSFIKKIESFSITFPMLGCWFACFIPLMFATLVLSQILLSFLPPLDGANGQLSLLLLSSLQAVLELVVSIIVSVAMAHGFKVLMDQK
jgi:hypothetical protein